MTKQAKILILSLCASTAIYAAGYKIPEQSLNSVALSAAYVANANGADASYYNPANMVWNENANLMEFDLTYINLPRVNYTGTVNGAPANAKSKEEQFLLPTLHFSSKDQGGWRYGLCVTAPGGLSKRWSGVAQQAKAKEFTLEVIELNPTFAYKINDKFAIGGGVRMVYSTGVVRAERDPLYSENMSGDDISFGYNLAVSYRPNDKIKFATTYRSKVNLREDGTANGYINTLLLGGPNNKIPYNTNANVAIPLPATLDIATSYTFKKKTTIEFVYERTYWSAYKNLDFNFDNTLTNGKTPIPSETLGFELPDADAKLYSVGFEYKYNKKISLGMSYLYDDKESRTITAGDDNENGIVGTFTHIRAHLLTAAIKYRF